MKRTYQASFLVFLLTLSSFAHAYVGPGAGLSALGTVAAFIGACLLIIVGFVWYPIKRLLKLKRLLKRGKKENIEQENSTEGDSGSNTSSEKPEQ